MNGSLLKGGNIHVEKRGEKYGKKRGLEAGIEE